MKVFVSMLALGATLLLPGFAATNQLYFTQFEPAEGYTTGFTLAGQQSWDFTGSGGNGLIPAGIQGQSAFIGFTPPNAEDDFLTLWRPINFAPVAASYPVVKFSVLLNLIDSTNGRYDIFRWSVYNQDFHRLFAIDFDNDYLDVSYLLDGTNQVVFTDLTLVNNSNYLLNVTMNFAANRWSATLNNAIIATNKAITTTGASLTLGDIDAVWLVNLVSNTNAPGDNYMMFDNYRITAEAAEVKFLDHTTEGWGLLRVSGPDGSRWAVDATTNFVNWTALTTNLISNGSFDLVDPAAAGQPRRFYRARHVP